MCLNPVGDGEASEDGNGMSPVPRMIWQGTGAQEMLVELNSDCSLAPHSELPTAISFSEVPFHCFGR